MSNPDIVERLRERTENIDVIFEAADLIEEQAAEIEHLRSARRETIEECAKVADKMKGSATVLSVPNGNGADAIAHAKTHKETARVCALIASEIRALDPSKGSET